MIVHWFIEPVSYGKESAYDIESPFHSNNVVQCFVARHFKALWIVKMFGRCSVNILKDNLYYS